MKRVELNVGNNKTRLNTDLTEEQRKEIKEAFDLFDSESTGVLNVNELKVALRSFGLDQTTKEGKQILGEIAGSGRKEINYEEFVNIMGQSSVKDLIKIY